MTNPQTVYDLLRARHPLQEGSFVLSGIQATDSGTRVALGWDRGNGQAKLASTLSDGVLVTLEVPNVHRSAEEVRAGERVTTYSLATQLHNTTWGSFGQPYWIGEDAFVGGQALQIGATDVRLADIRQIEFDMAVCVQFLRKMALTPGDYHIVTTFALPNDEIILPKPGDQNVGVIPTTRKALKSHFHQKAYRIEERDSKGHTHEWVLRFDQFGTQAQTMGAFLVYTRTPSGKPQLGNLTELNIYDLGFGDAQVTHFTFRPKYRMTAQRLGDGMRRVAETLARRIQAQQVQQGRTNQSKINLAKAQMIVRTKKVIEKGEEKDITPLIDDITRREGTSLAGEIRDNLRDASAYCLFVGGATKERGIRELLTREAEYLWRADAAASYHIFDESLASEANAIGAYLSTAWHIAAQRQEIGMAPVRKTVPLSPLAEQILPHLAESLHEQSGTIETQILTEALTRGLITMLPRAWHTNEHQWGSLPLERMVAELQQLVVPILGFLGEQDALDKVFRPYLALLPIIQSPANGGASQAAPAAIPDETLQSIVEAVDDLGELGFTMDFDDA